MNAFSRKLKLAPELPAMAMLAIASLLLTLPFVSGCKPKAGGDAKAGAPGAAASDNPPTPVNIASATEQTVSKLVPVTGSIAALQTVSIMPKVTANVLSIAGREGDTVRAGQVVVRLDPSDFEAQMRQAEANLQDAKAKLQSAQTNYKLQLTQSDTGVQNAQAALAAAQANLAVARQPQRGEQVKQSQIGVEQAQANYDKAVSDRTRYDALYKEGATSASTLESYTTAEKIQLATLENAKQGLQISNTGGRQEEIRASEEQVRQARIALQLARSNVQQNNVRKSDILSAQAAVSQNEATVAYQKQQVAYCTITSPINGIIASRTGEPGALAGPGMQTSSGGTTSGGGAILTVVALDTVYYQAQVPETDIGAVQPGRQVQVQVDAFPGRKFTGTVTTTFPSGSTSSRNFTVAIRVPNAGQLLRPGMYARGNVVTLSRKGVVVPKDALVSSGDGSQQAIFVAVNGKVAARHAVKVGIQTDKTSEILTGVHPGDQVIVAGQDGLRDGSPIQVEKTPADAGTTREASTAGTR